MPLRSLHLVYTMSTRNLSVHRNLYSTCSSSAMLLMSSLFMRLCILEAYQELSSNGLARVDPIESAHKARCCSIAVLNAIVQHPASSSLVSNALRCRYRSSNRPRMTGRRGLYLRRMKCEYARPAQAQAARRWSCSIGADIRSERSSVSAKRRI